MPPPKATKGKQTLVGHPAPPPPPKGRLPVPKIPSAGLPPIPRPKMKLVPPAPPSDPEPLSDSTLLPALEAAEVSARAAVFSKPEEVEPSVAFKVEPTTPPPLPKLPPIPTEAKRDPVPADSPDAAGPSRDSLAPPRLLEGSVPDYTIPELPPEPRLPSSLPPPPVDLRNPFDEPVLEEKPAAAAASGFDAKSGGIGFAVGAAVVALVAFLMWPDATTAPTPGLADRAPVAEDPVDDLADDTADDLADDEVAQDELAAEDTAEDTAEDAVEDTVADEPEEVAEEPVVVARAEPTRPEPRPEPRNVARPFTPRPRQEPVAARPTPRPEPVAPSRPVDDGPVIAAEPTTRPPRPVAPTGNVPATPSREDVATAIQNIRGQLQQCAPDLNGHVANIRFTFVSSGRATSAVVPNDFGSPPQRSCVARVARQAQVPAFSQPRLVVTYPVQF
ncbi:MAG: hypothetical protein H6719_08895 [Sandaracinaceae bacterium]|nr:hypothetical protein [Sandaracinaceae bacterium]